MYAIIDSETSGFKTGYIIQFAYILLDHRFDIQRVFNKFYRTPIMEEGAFKVHGYSKEILDKLGQSPFHTDRDLQRIQADLKGRTLIGHNVKFDIDTLNLNLSRIRQDPLDNNSFCTYIYLQFLHKYGKYPKGQRKKLENLRDFYYITEEDVAQVSDILFRERTGAHDARADVSTLYLALTTNKPLRDFVEYRIKKCNTL